MKHKKGQFNIMQNGLLTFMVFVLITVMVIATLSILKTTTMVCGGSDNPNETATSYNGVCYSCITNAVNSSQYFWSANQSCRNVSNNASISPAAEFQGYAYNGTKQLTQASLLPPQFASILVIVLIIVGILSLLAVIGYNVYQKMH